jgi:hypothetical protein
LNGYLDILSILSLLVFVVLLLQNQEKGLVVGILIKPLIDTSWDISIGPISIIEIFSVIFLFAAFSLIRKLQLKQLGNSAFTALWYLAHIGVLWSFLNQPMEGTKSLLKLLYFPISLVILPYLLLYSETVNQKRTLQYLVIGALFSSVISIFQFIGIIPYEYAHMSKGLQRANGFYHDMVTSRMYIMQGLVTLAYIKLSPRMEIPAWLTWALLLTFVFSGYTLFSKALLGIFAAGFVLVILTTKQKFIHLFIGFILLNAFVLSKPEVFETTEQLFTEEIAYQEGETEDTKRLFAGRGMLWEDFLFKFENSSVLEQIFGLGVNSGRTHNEFLRVLILSGYIGFLAFSALMLGYVMQVINQLVSNPMRFIQAFIVAILLLDAFSVVWGLYPFYLLIFLGFLQTVYIEHNYLNYESIDTKIRIW